MIDPVTVATTLIFTLFGFMLAQLSNRIERAVQVKQKEKEAIIQQRRTTSLQLVDLISLLVTGMKVLEANLFTLSQRAQLTKPQGIQSHSVALQSFKEYLVFHQVVLLVSIDYPELLNELKEFVLAQHNASAFYMVTINFLSKSGLTGEIYSTTPWTQLSANWQEAKDRFLLALIEASFSKGLQENPNEEIIEILRLLHIV